MNTYKFALKHLIKNKISVQGHLGILPQSQKGKFKVKGKTILEKFLNIQPLRL